MGTVRILSGWSNPGGSTRAFINLTNLLNDSGVDTIFYGPNEWHLDKCKAAVTQNLDISNPEDILIAHFIPLQDKKFPLKKIIFSCHETNLFPLKEHSLVSIDQLHFVSEKQRDWHDVDHSSVVIPNIVNVRKRKSNRKAGAVGIVGSIDSHKQTALAIQNALEMEPKSTKVLVFGSVTDLDYFRKEVKPLLENRRVRMMKECNDKDTMYDIIDAVYHASKYETYGLVKHECALHEIPFYDLFKSSSHSEYWPEERILEEWKKVLTE